MIILTASKILNVELTRFIKFTLGHGKIIARKQSATHDLMDPNSDITFVDHVEMMARHLEAMIVSPTFLSTLASSFENYRMKQIRITKTSLY